IGVLHLADGFLVDHVAEVAETPAFEHAGVQEVLVHRRQFIGQNCVEGADDRRIALHGRRLSSWRRREAGAALQTQTLPDAKAFTTANAAWFTCEYLSLH